MSTARPVVAQAIRIGALALSLGLPGAGAALAQGASCEGIQPLLVERKSISDKITGLSKGKKQIEARAACSGFGQLVTNGQKLVTWIDANKDWCQIPDGFVDGVKADHQKSVGIRAKACDIAAKQAAMEKKAREGGGGGGLLGGNGLSGNTPIPQGAL